MDATQRARQRLATLEAQGLLRRPPRITDRRGVLYRLEDRPVVGLCSNDYLGLADDPRLSRSDDAPSGAGASRLICGDLPPHRELEARLAELAGAEDAVLFPSGFQLNVGVLPTLLDADDHVDSDALNHASLIDGMRLATARPHILAHGSSPARVDGDAVHWWITESIFSMDGDRLDPVAAAEHLDGGGSMYVDEAHALGLFSGGRGWLAHHGIHPTVMVGTLSKAFGCAGAFVAAPSPVCALVRNRARSFVFSTGISPALVARITRAVELVVGPEGEARRERLWANTRRLLHGLGLPGEPPSPIVPVLVGDNARALRVADALLERGWHVQAIRPPTVPVGTARLRLTVSAAHEPEHIDGLTHDLLAILEREGLPLRVERGSSAPRDHGMNEATPDDVKIDATDGLGAAGADVGINAADGVGTNVDDIDTTATGDGTAAADDVGAPTTLRIEAEPATSNPSAPNDPPTRTRRPA